MRSSDLKQKLGDKESKNTKSVIEPTISFCSDLWSMALNIFIVHRRLTGRFEL